MLGIYNAPTESAGIWQEIIQDLKQRALQRCDLFVMDDLTGLDSAIESEFAHTRVQKCVLHLKRNVLKKVKKTHRQAMADDLKKVFDLDKQDDMPEQALSRSKAFYQQW